MSDNSNIYETLKKNMKFARLKSGYTQEDVADKLYVSRETVFRWEKLPEKMSFEKLVEVANLYNAKVTDFFMDNELTEKIKERQ